MSFDETPDDEISELTDHEQQIFLEFEKYSKQVHDEESLREFHCTNPYVTASRYKERKVELYNIWSQSTFYRNPEYSDALNEKIRIAGLKRAKDSLLRTVAIFHSDYSQRYGKDYLLHFKGREEASPEELIEYVADRGERPGCGEVGFPVLLGIVSATAYIGSLLWA